MPNNKRTAARHRLTLTLMALIPLLGVVKTACINASTFRPVITNLKPSDMTRDAGVQNWDIAQGANGEIYIGNNSGLLVYDGYSWRKAQIPGGMVIRSILVDGSRVYIGSYEEFGFFTVDRTGGYVYHSLSRQLKGRFPMDNEESWSITKHGGKIYFQSFNSLFIYDGRRVTPLHSRQVRPLYLHKIGSHLYAQGINSGYFLFDGLRYTPLLSRADYGNDNIVAAVSVKGGALLFSENKGLFSMTAACRLTPLRTEADDALRQYKINRATMTKDSVIVIGTILNGIYAISTQGRLLWHYDTGSGLLNNTVTRLFCDRDNNIWAALDNGVALIHTGSPCRVLTPDRRDPQIGMVFDILPEQGAVWMATNQGLYSYATDRRQINFTQGTGGQNWHITRIGSQLFLGNNIHTMTVNGATATPLAHSSSSTCMRRCTINGQDVLVEASYAELNIYRHNDASGRWEFSNTVSGFMAPVRQMEIDQNGTIWMANMNKGVFRLELTKDLKGVARKTLFTSLNDSTPTMNYVMKIRGRIAFSDNKRIYTYDDIRRRIIPYEQLNRISTASTGIHSATPVDGNTFWLSGRNGYVLMGCEDDEFRVLRFIPAAFFGVQGNENQDKVIVSGNTIYFNMNNCIARYSMDGGMRRWTVPKLRVAQATCATADDESTLLLPIGGNDADRADTERNIRLCYSFPNFNRERVTFRFALANSGGTVSVTETDAPVIEYKNLRYGSYTIHAQALNADGTVAARSTYSFRVPAPWWMSWWAVAAYLLMLAAAVVMLSKWRADRKLAQKRKEFEAEKAKQDIKMLEQEKLIALQQQQLLEAELSSKGKELADLSLNVYTKEKVIEGLKDTLRTHKARRAGGLSELDTLLRQIESATGSIEFLDIYRKNFDLIHEHFFRNLRERYPTLTANDLKFCALLRLNMSTKDIAAFTNLTVRGVETARYRLRRKLDLPSEQSLIEFLIDLK